MTAEATIPPWNLAVKRWPDGTLDIFLDRREGHLAPYLSGELHFDQRDERLCHRPLALVPTTLIARRAALVAPEGGVRIRTLTPPTAVTDKGLLARWAATHAEALGIARPVPTGHSS